MSKAAIPFALATAYSVQAVVCACHRYCARAVYWLAAATLTVSVTY